MHQAEEIFLGLGNEGSLHHQGFSLAPKGQRGRGSRGWLTILFEIRRLALRDPLALVI